MLKASPAAGDGVDFYDDRIFPVECGDAVSAADELTTDNAGKAVPATSADYVNAIALEDGVSGQIIAVKRPVAQPGFSAGEKLSTYASGGAISPTDRVALVTAEGTALTLANGTVGHLLTIRCVSASADSTLTIATAHASTSATWVFGAAGQEITLVYTATGWMLLAKKKAGAKTVVVGTTVLTGHRLWSRFDLSVTGTVHSTGTKSLPDGDFDGEAFEAHTTVAASTPIGDIDGNFIATPAASVTTHVTALGATSEYISARWSAADSAWLRLADTGITFN
jgi:hypothetical protein